MTPMNPYVARLLVDARQRDLLASAPPRRSRWFWSWLRWRPLPPSWSGGTVGSRVVGTAPAAPYRA